MFVSWHASSCTSSIGRASVSRGFRLQVVGSDNLNRLSDSSYPEHSMNRQIVAACFICALVGARRPLQYPNRPIRTRGAAIRRQAGRRTVCAAINPRAARPPTNASLHQAGPKRAQAIFAATLARAKRLDARGNRAGCTRALSAAKDMYNLQ